MLKTMKTLTVDFHSHILPNIDDGSKSVEESVKMLQLEAQNGIKTVIATPHFYGDIDTDIDFINRRNDAANILKKGIPNGLNLPNIILGAEVLYFDGIENWEAIPNLAIEGTNYILIELPMTPLSNRTLNILASFKENTGYTPIIAHLDRYISAFRTYNLPKTLSEIDVLVQINADFFLKFPNSVRALNLIKKGYVQLLGSDCHNCDFRPPNIKKAINIIENKLGSAVVEDLVNFQNLVINNL